MASMKLDLRALRWPRRKEKDWQGLADRAFAEAGRTLLAINGQSYILFPELRRRRLPI
ncbi:MAG: hypothetical protein KGJ23_00375 [Euryarchaeota archaeon]|nr:hypothetical protein [Euryarchaeota archaeon]MDE1835051.1 hypothetical protein [Euryarchaeota archaeon]MDE1879322.1 hypothetical protein [Euryarchaeota archaeon]MDE2044890.1 hypothetical protein [Thermoplasmata archaeon]